MQVTNINKVTDRNYNVSISDEATGMSVSLQYDPTTETAEELKARFERKISKAKKRTSDEGTIETNIKTVLESIDISKVI